MSIRRTPHWDGLGAPIRSGDVNTIDVLPPDFFPTEVRTILPGPVPPDAIPDRPVHVTVTHPTATWETNYRVEPVQHPCLTLTAKHRLETPMHDPSQPLAGIPSPVENARQVAVLGNGPGALAALIQQAESATAPKPEDDEPIDVQAEIDAIARRFLFPKEKIAAAFLQVRPNMKSDAAAVRAVDFTCNYMRTVMKDAPPGTPAPNFAFDEDGNFQKTISTPHASKVAKDYRALKRQARLFSKPPPEEPWDATRRAIMMTVNRNPGCRGGACRTFEKCICGCKRCKLECVDRENDEATMMKARLQDPNYNAELEAVNMAAEPTFEDFTKPG